MSRMQKRWSWEEAAGKIPEFRQRTEDALSEIQLVFESRGLTFDDDLTEAPAEIAAEVDRIVTEWATDIRSDGVEVKGMWLVDFDSGSGFYCWRYPEESLGFYHGYEEGFRGRVPLN